MAGARRLAGRCGVWLGARQGARGVSEAVVARETARAGSAQSKLLQGGAGSVCVCVCVCVCACVRAYACVGAGVQGCKWRALCAGGAAVAVGFNSPN